MYMNGWTGIAQAFGRHATSGNQGCWQDGKKCCISLEKCPQTFGHNSFCTSGNTVRTLGKNFLSEPLPDHLCGEASQLISLVQLRPWRKLITLVVYRTSVIPRLTTIVTHLYPLVHDAEGPN